MSTVQGCLILKTTQVTCATNIYEPDKLNVGEEILLQCELESQFHEDYSPNINEGLAKRVLKYFDKGAEHSEPRTKLFKKYKPPANLAGLDAPRINPGIATLSSFNTYIKSTEAKFYDIQQNINRATIAVENIADKQLSASRCQKSCPKLLGIDCPARTYFQGDIEQKEGKY